MQPSTPSRRAPMPRALLVALATLAASAAPAAAAELTIPPGSLQLVEFESEAPVENIRGLSTEARGTVTFDPANPGTARGEVRVPVASLRTGNTTRDEDLRGQGWLDGAGHPELVFVVDALDGVSGPVAPDAPVAGRLRGRLTIKGVTRSIEVPVKLAWLLASDKLKRAYIPGNALRVKGQLEVRLADFDIHPPDHILGVKVADTVTVRFALTALEK